MSDWAFGVFRGLHPMFLVFLVLGVAAKARSRRWRTFDQLLFAAFLLLAFLSAFQVWMFYGKLATSKRYLWIAVPLYLPFAAQGAIALWDLLKKTRIGRFAAVVSFVLFALGELYNFSTPVVKLHRPCAKQRECAAARHAAAWIARDSGSDPKRDRFRAMKCDEYQSGRSPLVLSEQRQIGYLCGGQSYPEFFRSLGIGPDYLVVAENAPVPNGFVRVKEVAVGDERLVICKRRKTAK